MAMIFIKIVFCIELHTSYNAIVYYVSSQMTFPLLDVDT